jgi:hypothetical protein
MDEGNLPASRSIAEELMCIRLAQSEQMREFFLQMWLQNPLLARRPGKRIQDLLLPLDASDSNALPSGP